MANLCLIICIVYACAVGKVCGVACNDGNGSSGNTFECENGCCGNGCCITKAAIGVIAGSVIGVLLFVVFMVVCLNWCCCKKSSMETERDQPIHSSHINHVNNSTNSRPPPHQPPSYPDPPSYSNNSSSGAVHNDPAYPPVKNTTKSSRQFQLDIEEPPPSYSSLYVGPSDV